jgi:RNA polymerase sigma factor (sigma-70 family)
MTADFTLAIQFAQISAKRCARRYNLDLDVCLSEAYLAISSRLPKFDPEKTQLSTYVYRVVTNQIIDYLRSECLTARAKQTQRLQDDADFGCSSSYQDDDADVAARLALTFAEGGSQARSNRSCRIVVGAAAASKMRLLRWRTVCLFQVSFIHREY